ncbi:hypothetical protein BRD56_09160 [Thermoplasmatales archaeon SW_10_69_26]|nr:MAG: hypothetical protein BRD56_09160 [Thermoplasmatales archaeon SW_10_69_26]
MTVGLVPTAANAQEICADAGPAELCVADPLVHDAGEITVTGQDVSAEANGGIATGVGSATFAVDYTIDAPALASDEQLVVDGDLVIRDSNGYLVAREDLTESLTAGESVTGELQTTVETVAPLVDGGSITVDSSADIVQGYERTRVGAAQSASPVTVVATPHQDVADRTTAGDTITVGYAEAGPTQADADVIDGELIVATDTAVRLEMTGELSSKTFNGVDNLRQDASASLRAFNADGFYERVRLAPIEERCYSNCSTQDQTVPVELSIVIPGDAENPDQDLRLQTGASWSAFYYDGFYQDEAFSDSAEGLNDLLAAGT